MSQSLAHIPQARSWREIPQPVKPRSMSREGRWRLIKSALRTAGVSIVLGALGWGAWIVSDVVQGQTRELPAVARADPVGHFELKTDGVLGETWLRQTLALGSNASLMGLDLERLRARLLRHGQVNSATLSRKLPDTLVVQLTERSPVVRIMAQVGDGEPKAWLVARDGVIFDGLGFDPTMVASLPWLDGVQLRPDGGGFFPLGNIAPAADLLAKARWEAEHLYRTWMVISLARLESDREIDVRTKQGTLIVFAANGDYFLQLARLNSTLEKLAAAPTPPSKIDLSLGREVPVAFDPAAGQPGLGAVAPRAGASSGFSVFPQSQPNSKREL